MIHLRAYAQKTPINEYKQEAFALFERMLETIREDVTRILCNSELKFPAMDQQGLPELPDFLTAGQFDPFAPTGVEASARVHEMAFGEAPRAAPDPYAEQNLSRNALCPCGSGKKYKHCHGTLA